MKVNTTPIADLLVLEPTVLKDQRGHFLETWNQQAFHQAVPQYGLANTINFVQDNESFSTYGVLRGLHFQQAPFAQSKLVRAIQGEILDVAVDLRPHSTTFGQHFSLILTGNNKKQLLIPQGLAHGFVVLSPEALVAYKCDQFYAKASEGGIRFDDSFLNINWLLPSADLRLSDKDLQLPSFQSWKEKL